MTITVHSDEGYLHSIEAGGHTFFSDLPEALGGKGLAPSPHDYFDAALGACKAQTLRLYAQRRGIPLEGIRVEVTRNNSQESTGHYGLEVKLTLSGTLSVAQRKELDRVADHCPVHNLMTTAQVSVTTYLAEDPPLA